MPLRDVVVIGGSAGGVEALLSLVRGMPSDLPAAVLVVVHRSATGTNALPRILSRVGTLPASPAVDGQELTPGTIWVAVPDHHLLVHDGSMLLRYGPRENLHRPAIDPLLRSAARWYGARVVAVALSGALDDGAVGAAVVRSRGGAVLVQDPAEALIPSMPEAVMAAVPDAVVAPAEDLGKIIGSLVGRPVPDLRDAPGAELIWETDVALSNGAETPNTAGFGVPVELGCPDCSGGMFEFRTGTTVHYRCHTGHAWSPLTLLEAERDAAESSLMAAAAKLREESVVLRRLADRAAVGGDGVAQRAHQKAAGIADGRARTVQHLLDKIRRLAAEG